MLQEVVLIHVSRHMHACIVTTFVIVTIATVGIKSVRNTIAIVIVIVTNITNIATVTVSIDSMSIARSV